MRIVDGQLIIDLTSSLVTFVILIATGAWGYARGLRYMLSIALFTTIAYVLTIQANNFIVDIINRFYTNGPKLFAFAFGRDPSTVAPLPPLIPETFEAPLFLRVLVFIALVAVGIGYAFPWEKPLKGFGPPNSNRILGSLLGLYIGTLWISATAIFWGAASGSLNLPDGIEVVLNSFPTFAPVVPAMIAAFLVLLVVLVLVQIPQIWSVSAPPAKK